MIGADDLLWDAPPPAVDEGTFGMELVLDLVGCDLEVITSSARLAGYARELCDVIGMTAYGEPIVQRFGLAAEKTAGFTLVQLIETSSIVAHFSEAWGAAYINVFSCRTFHPDAVVAFTESRLHGRCASRAVLLRGAPRPNGRPR